MVLFLFTDTFYDVPPIWSQNQFDLGWLFHMFHHRWDLVNDELYTKFEKTILVFVYFKILSQQFLFVSYSSIWRRTETIFIAFFALRYSLKIYLLLIFLTYYIIIYCGTRKIVTLFISLYTFFNSILTP